MLKCKLWGQDSRRWYAYDQYGLLIMVGGLVSVVTSVKPFIDYTTLTAAQTCRIWRHAATSRQHPVFDVLLWH